MTLQKAKFKDGRTIPQTYTACNGKYYIEKGTVGWNLYKVTNKRGFEEHEFITAYETLKDLRADNGLQ